LPALYPVVLFWISILDSFEVVFWTLNAFPIAWLILTIPELSIRNRSVRLFAPSAVVSKTIRPGMSFDPGVPSTSALILAAEVATSVPSAPLNKIAPSWSPLCTATLLPNAPLLDLLKISKAPLAVF